MALEVFKGVVSPIFNVTLNSEKKHICIDGNIKIMVQLY